MVRDKTYTEWLSDIVCNSGEYTLLLEHLHELIFEPLIPNDDNRAVDGMQLRDRYLDEVGPTGPISIPDSECTVLELLVGLAFRLEFELLGGQYEQPVSHWFWVLIDNLNLTDCTDRGYLYGDSREKVDHVIDILVSRQYDTDGEGGLFPLSCAKKDQRRVEIWYQMSSWVIENYPI